MKNCSNWLIIGKILLRLHWGAPTVISRLCHGSWQPIGKFKIWRRKTSVEAHPKWNGLWRVRAFLKLIFILTLQLRRPTQLQLPRQLGVLTATPGWSCFKGARPFSTTWREHFVRAREFSVLSWHCWAIVLRSVKEKVICVFVTSLF
jgi:hypothetical protein